MRPDGLRFSQLTVNDLFDTCSQMMQEQKQKVFVFHYRAFHVWAKRPLQSLQRSYMSHVHQQLQESKNNTKK